MSHSVVNVRTHCMHQRTYIKFPSPSDIMDMNVPFKAHFP